MFLSQWYSAAQVASNRQHYQQAQQHYAQGWEKEREEKEKEAAALKAERDEWMKQNREQQRIVNNESADIIRMFNSAFDSISGVDQIDYYPEPLRARIDSLNEKIYENVNNGVYRCGFSSSQQAYNDAFELLFDTLDELDDLLGNQRYLCGEMVTEADWRLFSTLVRFDLAYHGQFKCNRQQLKDYINLWPYCRDLYQLPRVADTVDIDAIKGIYYGGRGAGVIPRGPVIDFEEPHNRG